MDKKKNAESFTKLGILYVYYKLQSCSVTVFEFLAASTRAGLIPAYSNLFTYRLLRGKFPGVFHDICPAGWMSEFWFGHL